MKKNQFFRKISLICILASSLNSQISASDDFDDFADYDLGNETQSIGQTRATLPPINPADLNISTANYQAWFTLLSVTDLFDPTSSIKVKNVLLNNFFLQSNRLVSRNINNYPFALHYDYSVSEQDTFNTNLFMNTCTRKYISDTGNTLESIVDFENQGIEDILSTIDYLNPGSPISDSSNLELFAPGRIEERKMGGLFQYMRRNEIWFFRAQVPFMYIERNLQFTQAQKDAIYNSPLVQILANWANNNSGNPVPEKELAEEFFVVDQIGFGNVHLGGMHDLIDTHAFQLKLGGYIEFPTEWAFKQGIKGTWYEQNNSGRNPLIMGALPLDSATWNQAQQDMFTAFFLGCVNQMSANVLATSLGNSKHTAFAIQTDFAWYPFESAYFQGYFAGQYMLPAKEQRFFIKKAGNGFTQYLATIDPATATVSQQVAVVQAFSQEMQDRLYPYVFTTEVQPGLMFNLFASVEIPVHAWHFSLGANGWYQAKETLFNIEGNQISAPGSLVPNLNSSSEILALLDLDAAQGFAAYQFKPFVQINYYCDYHQLTTLSLYADYTVANEATGNDLTINLSFSMKF